jgi:hypothetical protein
MMTSLTALRHLGVGVVLIAVLAACSSTPASTGTATPTDATASPAATVAAPSAAVTAAPPTAIPSPAPPTAAAANPICDVWLSPDAIVATFGRAATQVVGYNFLNTGQPVDCTWTFADGSEFRFIALDQTLDGEKLPSGAYDARNYSPENDAQSVTGLGLAAFYSPSTCGVVWFPDHEIRLAVGDCRFTKAQLIAFAHRVTVPSPLPVAP